MLLRQDRYRAYTPPYLLYGLLSASLLLNLYMVMSRPAPDADPEEVIAALSPETAEGETSLQDRSAAAERMTTTELLGGGGEWQVMQGAVTRTLAQTFEDGLESGADVMTATYGRLFMWDFNLRRDIQKNDMVSVLWRPTGDGLIEVDSAWLDSGKKGRTLKIYRYKAPGERYHSFWSPDGTEVPLRLQGGPIEDYEQITSLFRDARKNHQGMDFKTEVGTPVFSPKAGTVTRVNWQTGVNGNCVEVRFADGTLARFLHLDEVSVKAGQHVKSGQMVAASGNTGRSSGPHLHYELSRNGKTIDPLDYHGTIRRQLDPASMKGFRKEIKRIDRMMGIVPEDAEG